MKKNKHIFLKNFISRKAHKDLQNWTIEYLEFVLPKFSQKERERFFKKLEKKNHVACIETSDLLEILIEHSRGYMKSKKQED